MAAETELLPTHLPGARCLVRMAISRRLLISLALFALLGPALHAQMVQTNVLVSVRDQKLMLLQDGFRLATYPISTSKFGLGDNWGAMTTPTGTLQVAQKIGDHAPTGAVFHNRRFTGEILSPNAPGRDPVITRIIWLRGLEAENAHAYNRCIYIHGTPEEKRIGQPASFGCVRMKSADVSALYAQLPIGAIVRIIPDSLPRVSRASRAMMAAARNAATVPPTVLGLGAEATKTAGEQVSVPGRNAASARKTELVALARNPRA